MTLANSSHHSGRVLLVAVGGGVAFMGIGFLIYSMYFSLTDQVYDPGPREGLVALQFLFYTFFALHLLASAGTVWLLTRWVEAPAYPVLAVVVAMAALAALPTLWMLSFTNTCETNVSFPFPGMSC